MLIVNSSFIESLSIFQTQDSEEIPPLIETPLDGVSQ